MRHEPRAVTASGSRSATRLERILFGTQLGGVNDVQVCAREVVRGDRWPPASWRWRQPRSRRRHRRRVSRARAASAPPSLWRRRAATSSSRGMRRPRRPSRA
eukprot:396948-Prymnesium_polylepis.1